jgi:hypothetical protein
MPVDIRPLPLRQAAVILAIATAVIGVAIALFLPAPAWDDDVPGEFLDGDEG